MHFPNRLLNSLKLRWFHANAKKKNSFSRQYPPKAKTSVVSLPAQSTGISQSESSKHDDFHPLQSPYSIYDKLVVANFFALSGTVFHLITDFHSLPSWLALAVLCSLDRALIAKSAWTEFKLEESATEEAQETNYFDQFASIWTKRYFLLVLQIPVFCLFNSTFYLNLFLILLFYKKRNRPFLNYLFNCF